uniref:Myotubularin-related protein 12 n=2 Tax=Cyprinus carpio TaxID=7962 RepID=A0A9J7YAF7_CYPCA
MLSLGSGGAKSTKPSFVSYVTPEEIKSEKDPPKQEKHPDLLPGEVEFCSANPILKYTQDDLSQRGVFGTLFCTNFRVTFISDEKPQEKTDKTFKNKLYGENDIPLMCVDHIYGVYDEKRKLITGGLVKNKYPSKMIIHCKDLRVFQFSLTFSKEEDAKKIFQGIAHHCLEEKSLKCVFAFSYMGTPSPGTDLSFCREMQWKQETVMFDSPEDWTQEMKRTKANCRLVTENENFELSQRLPKYFVIPLTIGDLFSYQGKGLPIWCWSHYSGCALFKASFPPVTQEDGDFQKHLDTMINAVAHNHLYSVKTEDLSESLPNIQDIQQSYNKFKQFFLIENSTDFWLSDVKWFSSLESSGWLDIIRQCLQKAVEVVECLEKDNTNVLITEEEGTDLCCVISSLAQIMLDPYYRTLMGFQSLVQKEWVAGCHAFLDRCNHLHQKDKEVIIACSFLPVSSDAILQPEKSPLAQSGPLSCPTVWDWSVQFDSKAQNFFFNPLYLEKVKHDRAVRKPHKPKHQRNLSLPSTAFKTPPKKGFFKDETDSLKKMLRVKRLSRWRGSPDAPAATTREFFESWQHRPLDYHGLLLPCLDGPAVHIWMQRYLRWIPEVYILGGGSVAVMTKLMELLSQVQDLKRVLEQRDSSQAAKLDHRPYFQHRLLSFDSSGRLSSSFPFAYTCYRSFKPIIPTGLMQSLMVTDSLASQEDEASSVVSFV